MDANSNSLFFQLFVRTASGKTITIDIEPADTIDTVKDKIRHKDIGAIDQQWLVYAGKQLQNGHTVSEYSIGPGSTLGLVPRLLGGCYFCHQPMQRNPSAPSHRSERCTDPRNSHGRNHPGGAAATPRAAASRQCKYGSACYRQGNPQHCAKYSHSSSGPHSRMQMHSGKEWVMYHGTSRENAVKIKASGGLQPSSTGMLGAGVYCSRELQKAMAYATPPRVPHGNGVIFELRVRPGKVKAIRSMNHPLQHTWHQAGYDTAWVPPGVNPSGLEEDCVWDASRVRITRVAWTNCGFIW